MTNSKYTVFPKGSQVLAFTCLIGVGVSQIAAPASAGPVTLAKDTGPASARCDGVLSDRSAWLACIGHPVAAKPSTELFYAGYWLARSGSYKEALKFLLLADQKDPRVLTYIGFSLRKSGNIESAFGYYTDALALDPNYNVARAYLGEAHLTQNDVPRAKAELNQIATRCGTNCAEYIDLAGHIQKYENARRHG